MQLEVRGHPLHTRSLTVNLQQREDAKLDVHTSIVDVRKRGFVPVAGDLQAGGIVHLMMLDAVVDPATMILERITASQPAVAFEPSALTRGESCRDPIGRIVALEGTQLDTGYPRRLSDEIGGTRGCSHILTLAQLMGSAIRRAVALDPAPPHRPGERIFHRDVVLDGFEVENGQLEMAVQLTDLSFAPAPAISPPMDRFGTELEVRVLATVEMKNVGLTALRAWKRERARDDLETAAWVDRSDLLGDLIGKRLLQGISGDLLRLLADRRDERPLLDALLMIAPGFVQCSAGLSEPWAVVFRESPSIVAMGGFVDSCYMWRRDGALSQARKKEEPPPRLW